MEKAKKPRRVEGVTFTAEGTAGPKLLWGGQNTPISFFSYPKVTRTDPVSEVVPSQTLAGLWVQSWRRLLGVTRVTQMHSGQLEGSKHTQVLRLCGDCCGWPTPLLCLTRVRVFPVRTLRVCSSISRDDTLVTVSPHRDYLQTA